MKKQIIKATNRLTKDTAYANFYTNEIRIRGQMAQNFKEKSTEELGCKESDIDIVIENLGD